ELVEGGVAGARQAADALAARQQLPDDGAAEEAAAAGDERVHEPDSSSPAGVTQDDDLAPGPDGELLSIDLCVVTNVYRESTGIDQERLDRAGGLVRLAQRAQLV